MAKNNIAIYPGTFDPITNGHLDIISRALEVFDRLLVAVTVSENTLFSADERVSMIKEAASGLNVEAEAFDGLLVEYAKRKGCFTAVRGLRAISDFDFEFQLHSMNKKLNPKFETLFIMTSDKYAFLSSSAVKEVARHHGDIGCFVPECVEKVLKGKYPG